MFLFVVKAYSKWLEVFTVRQATAARTVDILQTLFSCTGLPQKLMSDNGTHFTGTEFQYFVRRNGNRHITLTPISCKKLFG